MQRRATGQEVRIASLPYHPNEPLVSCNETGVFQDRQSEIETIIGWMVEVNRQLASLPRQIPKRDEIDVEFSDLFGGLKHLRSGKFSSSMLFP